MIGVEELDEKQAPALHQDHIATKEVIDRNISTVHGLHIEGKSHPDDVHAICAMELGMELYLKCYDLVQSRAQHHERGQVPGHVSHTDRDLVPGTYATRQQKGRRVCGSRTIF